MSSLLIVSDRLPENRFTKIFDEMGFTVLESSTNRSVLVEDERQKDIEAILTRSHPPINEEVLQAFPLLKIVSNFGSGTDHIDLKACEKRGVIVTNTPIIELSTTTANMAVTLALAATRQLISAHLSVVGTKDAVVKADSELGTLIDSNCAVGIIGMGKIGKEIARQIHNGFEAPIFYYQRTRLSEEEERRFGAKHRQLNALISNVDLLFVSCPLTDLTRKMLSTREFERMREGVIIVSVARGDVIDTMALLEALRVKRVKCAALDVTEPEPLPKEHPLCVFAREYPDRCVFSPHIGSAVLRTREAMMRAALRNIRAALTNEGELENVLVGAKGATRSASTIKANESTTELFEYKGSCHCGKVTFSIKIPKITKVVHCNCSICEMKGFLHVGIKEKTSLTILSGEDNLSTYTFGTHTAKHTFCSTCGIHPFYVPRSNPNGYDVNFKCLDLYKDDHETKNIKISGFDGQFWEENIAKLAKSDENLATVSK